MFGGRRRQEARKSPDRAWRRALAAAVEGRWETTETWLERLVEADSDDLEAYHALARLYRRQGAVGRAIRMHQNLLLRPDLEGGARIEAMDELARDFDAGGFVGRAIASYEEVLARRPRDARVLERLVELHADQGERTRALALVRRLRRRNPELAHRREIELLRAQAEAAHAEGDAIAARRTLKRCLRRDPGCAGAWTLLGQIEAERGKDARALEAWKKAATADPTRAAPLYPRIEATFAARGKPLEFERFLRDLLERRPGDRAATLALARSLGSRGDSAAAVEELERAIAASPDDCALRAELGRQLLTAGYEAEALKAFQDLLGTIERLERDASRQVVG
mgnify:CR=1 FL=1